MAWTDGPFTGACRRSANCSKLPALSAGPGLVEAVKFRSPTSFANAGRIGTLAAVWGLLGLVDSASAVPITGANGTTVDFAGVREATPAGLVVVIAEGGEEVTVPWSKFDLNRLKSEHTAIFSAYQLAGEGKTTGLYLGVFENLKPQAEMPQQEVPAAEHRKSFVETTVLGAEGSGFREMKVALRRPRAETRAFFVGIFGEGGGAGTFSSLPIAIAKASGWDAFLEENRLVPVGVRVVAAQGDPRKQPFFLADQGSGDALLNAIADLAKQSGREDLADAPLVIYGRETVGSAFAYNLAQWKPDRVLCGVAMKGGAFFQVEPSEASAKVPLLLVKGEYDDSHREWQLQPTVDESGRRIDPAHEAVNRYRSSLELRPNWTLVIEPRGNSDISAMTETLGREFVSAVIRQRYGSGQLSDMHPDIAQMGNLTTVTTTNMPDGQGVLAADETWLPDPQFAKVWAQFIKRELVPPAPGPRR